MPRPFRLQHVSKPCPRWCPKAELGSRDPLRTALAQASPGLGGHLGLRHCLNQYPEPLAQESRAVLGASLRSGSRQSLKRRSTPDSGCLQRLRHGRHLPPPMPSCHNREVAGPGEPAKASHISKMLLPTIHSGPTCVPLPCHGIRFGLRASVGPQSPQPHLEDSSAYRQNRPTKLDRIKNLRAEVQVEAVIGRFHSPIT